VKNVGFQVIISVLCSSERTWHLAEHISTIFRVKEKPADSAGILLGFSLTLKMEVIYSSETVDCLQTAWCYNPEGWMDPSEVNFAK
jgi:hypothetical protein